MIDFIHRLKLYVKEQKGELRADGSVSEALFLPTFLSWLASVFPSPPFVPFPSLEPSICHLHCLMFIPSLASMSSLPTAARVPGPHVPFLPALHRPLGVCSLRVAELQGACGSHWSLHPLCHHPFFAQTWTVTRHAVPAYTRSSFLPLYLCIWSSFGWL